MLRQFGDFARQYAIAKTAPSGQECTDLTNLRQGLLPLKDLAKQLNEVLASDWPTLIDRQRLADEAQVYKLPAPFQAADFQQWLREAQDYYIYHPEDLAGRIAALNAAADTTAAKIKAVPDKIPDYSKKSAALAARLEGLRVEIDLLSKQQASKQGVMVPRHWVQKDRRNGVLAAEAASLLSRVQGIGQDADRVTAENTPDQKKWWDTFVLTPPTADQSVVNDAWIAWRNRLSVTRDQLPLDVSEFNKLRDAVQQWKTALSDVDKLFPLPPAVEAPYDSIASEKRRSAIQAAVKAADGPDPLPDSALMMKAATDSAPLYQKWCEDLPRFVEDIHEAKAQLDLGYGLDDSQAGSLAMLADWKNHSVWKDLSGQGEVAAVEQRFAALESLAQASRAELADISGKKSGAPELVLAAWKRLGKQNPAWPATPEELRREKSIYLNLVLFVGQFKDRIRGDQLGKGLAEEEFKRVVAFLNSPREPSQVEPAFAAAVGAWPGSPDFGSLPLQPLPRYNSLLYALRANMARFTRTGQTNQPDDRAAILKICDQFRQGVSKLPADLQTEPDVAGLLHQLDSLKIPEPPHGPPDPWKSETVSDGVLTFMGTIAGGRRPCSDSSALMFPMPRRSISPPRNFPSPTSWRSCLERRSREPIELSCCLIIATTPIRALARVYGNGLRPIPRPQPAWFNPTIGFAPTTTTSGITPSNSATNEALSTVFHSMPRPAEIRCIGRGFR